MPIPLRPDFDATRLRCAARVSKDAGQARRLLALAAISEGATRTQAAAIGGVTLQVIRDWVVRFNAHGPDGLIDRKAPGPPCRLDDAQRAALAAMVESGPVPAVHGVVAPLGRHEGELRHAIPLAKKPMSAKLAGMLGAPRWPDTRLDCVGSGCAGFVHGAADPGAGGDRAIAPG